MQLGGWRNKSEDIFSREQVKFWLYSVHMEKVAVSVLHPKRGLLLFLVAILLSMVTKSYYILRMDFLHNWFWTSPPHHFVLPHDSKCQTISLPFTWNKFWHKSSRNQLHKRPCKPSLFINQPLVPKSWIKFLSYKKNPHLEAHSYCQCCESHKKVTGLHSCTVFPGSNAFGAAYF